jgi:hypothetical protein
MSLRRYALIVVALMAIVRAVCGQTLLPQVGVVVLRNGQVLDGQIIRAGDFVIVSKGEGSELRLKSDEVELVCASMDEAYDFKARHVSGLSAKPHVELAKWCLRHALYEKCEEQLAAAAGIEPDNRELKEMQTRLKLAVEKPPEPTPARAAPTVAADDLEKALRDLPRGSIEKFGAVVQPILLNRCGANKCHGPNTDSEFRLLKPAPGQIVSRRFTQRNLYAALKQLDGANPDASPLVVLPQQRHGSSLSAVFDKHSANQLAELAAWARMTVGVAPAVTQARGPATIGPMDATLSQPLGAEIRMSRAAERPSGEAGAAPSGVEPVKVMRPPLDDRSGGKEPAGQLPLVRDRFDPEIFNRRYHGK